MSGRNRIQTALAFALIVSLGTACNDPQYNWFGPQKQNTAAKPSGTDDRTAKAGTGQSQPEIAPPPRDEDRVKAEVESYVNNFDTPEGRSAQAANGDNRNNPESISDNGNAASSAQRTPTREPAVDGMRVDTSTADGRRSPRNGTTKPPTSAGNVGSRHADDQPLTREPDESPVMASPAIINMSVTAAPVGRTTATPEAAGANQGRTAETAQPMTARIAAMEASVLTDPNNLDAQFRLRMLYLAEGMDEKAMVMTPGMTRDNEDLVGGVIRLMTTARSRAGRDPAEWSNRQLESIDSLRKLVAQNADLRVPRVALCSETVSFGDYREITPAEFRAGQSQDVIVYIEVDNLRHDRLSTGDYRARISVRLSLLDRSGQEIWTRMEDTIEDVCKNEREDFFLSLIMTVPSALNPGQYTLKASVSDLLGGKTDENQAPFRVVAK